MNSLLLLKDLEVGNANFFKEVEKLAISEHGKVFSVGYNNIPKAWTLAVIESLNKAGYLVTMVNGLERAGQLDNVVMLRRKF